MKMDKIYNEYKEYAELYRINIKPEIFANIAVKKIKYGVRYDDNIEELFDQATKEIYKCNKSVEI